MLWLYRTSGDISCHSASTKEGISFVVAPILSLQNALVLYFIWFHSCQALWHNKGEAVQFKGLTWSTQTLRLEALNHMAFPIACSVVLWSNFECTILEH